MLGQSRKCCRYTLTKCVNCRGTHYAMSTIRTARKQKVIIVQSGRDERRTRELDMQKAREELTRMEEEEEAEKAQKE